MKDSIKLVAIVAPLGILLSIKKKDVIRKVFEYRKIKVTLTRWKDKGWSWFAEPIYEIKSLWEWAGWPIDSKDKYFETSQEAALDSIRIIDESVPF